MHGRLKRIALSPRKTARPGPDRTINKMHTCTTGPIIGPYQSFFDNFNLKSNNCNGVVAPEYYRLTHRRGARTMSHTLVPARMSTIVFLVFIVSHIRRHDISIPLNRAVHRVLTNHESFILLRVLALSLRPETPVRIDGLRNFDFSFLNETASSVP